MDINLEKTLRRREKISATIQESLKEAPDEAAELLALIAKLYYSGSISRFWDFLAALSGNERGYGNDWYFTACEIKKHLSEDKNV